MLVIDQHAVGLDAVGPVALEAPRPQGLQVVFRDEQGFTTEKRERAALPLDGGLHRLNVVGARDVAGIALRVLVAVLTLNVAGDAQRPKLHAHRIVLPASDTADLSLPAHHRHTPLAFGSWTIRSNVVNDKGLWNWKRLG